MRKERILLIILLAFFGLSLIAATFLVFRRPPLEKVGITEDIRILTLRKANLAIVYIYGPIQIEQPGIILAGGADHIVRRIKAIRKDPEIKAVVLRINSPGGSVGAVQEIYNEVLKLREAGKKVVASLGEIATSGAYYIACAADKIVANPGTITGSIGVLFPLINLEELFKKLGISVEIIKSDEHKDIGSSLRPPTEEEKRMLKEIVDNAYQQFIGAVRKGRKELMTEEQFEKAFDGRIMTGEQAKEMNLIDKLGNFEDAIKIAAKLAGIEEDRIRIDDEKRDFRRFFWQIGTRVSTPLQRILPQSNALQYLWLPGY